MKGKIRKFTVLVLSLIAIACFAFACDVPDKNGEQPPHMHVYSTEYSYDADSHWFECECGEDKGNELHSFIDGKCSCGYEKIEELPGHTHNYIVNYDSIKHWEECSCNEKKNVGQHVFVDGKCSCGYEKAEAPGHTHSYIVNYDDIKHWEECSCNEKKNIRQHRFVDGKCSCGYEKAEESEHTHSYKVCYDDEAHWEECSCNEKKNIEQHRFVDGKCSCGYSKEEKNNTFIDTCSNAENHNKFMVVSEKRKATCCQEQLLVNTCPVCNGSEIVSGNKDESNHGKYVWTSDEYGNYSEELVEDFKYNRITEYEELNESCRPKTCNDCGKVYDNHEITTEWKDVIENANKCTEERLQVKYCTVCKAVISDITKQPALGHKYVMTGEKGYTVGCASYKVILTCEEPTCDASVTGHIIEVTATKMDDAGSGANCDVYYYQYTFAGETKVGYIKMNEVDDSDEVPDESMWTFSVEPEVIGKGATATYTAGVLNGVCKNTANSVACGATGVVNAPATLNSKNEVTSAGYVETVVEANCCDAGSVNIKYYFNIDTDAEFELVKEVTLVIEADGNHDPMDDNGETKAAVYFVSEDGKLLVFQWCYEGEKFVKIAEYAIQKGECTDKTHSADDLIEVYQYENGDKLMVCPICDKVYTYKAE